MTTWTRQPQEVEGTYFFNGKFLVTRKVQATLSDAEIRFIYQNVQQFVKDENGIDYLQVFTDENGRKLFFMDQLNKEMIESGGYKKEYNYCTLMYPEER